MLYNCGCDSRVIDIPTKLYFTISDSELERQCTEGYGCHISNPWYKSFTETNGVVLTVEQVEELKEQEYEEEEDPINVDLNLPADHWE